MDSATGTPSAALTILLVDDAPDMRFLARAVLEESGMDVVAEAVDGLEAIERFHELRSPTVPTVILLDNQMPKLGGIEAAAQILAEAPDQLIVLFSAYLSESIQREAERLGVAACVSKTNVLDLPDIITKLVAARP